MRMQKLYALHTQFVDAVLALRVFFSVFCVHFQHLLPSGSRLLDRLWFCLDLMTVVPFLIPTGWYDVKTLDFQFT